MCHQQKEYPRQPGPLLSVFHLADWTWVNRSSLSLSRSTVISVDFHCSLKPVDVELMKVLHHKVNVVPIIAKADSLTETELKIFKRKVMDDLDKHRINFYQPPICGSDEEDEFKAQDAEIRVSRDLRPVIGRGDSFGDCRRHCRFPWSAAMRSSRTRTGANYAADNTRGALPRSRTRDTAISISCGRLCSGGGF